MDLRNKPQADMTHEEFVLYRARKAAADFYRHEGEPEAAQRIEAGEGDDWNYVRLMRWWFETL